MKNTIKHLSFLLLVVLGLPSCAYAQVSGSADQNSSSLPPAAQRRTGVMTDEELAKIDPALEERERYQRFLMHVHITEMQEASLRERGYTEMSEALRIELQTKSGLSEEEATKVKKIAADYMVDLDALNKKGNELNAKYNHHRPPLAESAPLSQESVDIVNKATARLVDALGSRSFSRLDLYTRHYLDAAKAKTDADAKAAAVRREIKP